MRSKIILLFLVTLLFSISCSGNNYADGNYCAEVKYYNPNTGTRSAYILQVEVKNNKLMVIRFSNGGWLDDSHFTPPTIKDGKAMFVSDRNYRYEIKLLNKGKCNYNLERTKSE